jgi:long-subunit fatty acid transport protein
MALAGLGLGSLLAPGALNRAGATPLENTHVGGVNRGSVVEPHPASMARNPAAIGLLPGTHAFVDGTVRLTAGRIRRAPINSQTGVPGSGADVPFERERYAHFTPDLYFGATSDLGTDRVVLGVALFTPFAELQSYDDPVASIPPTKDASLRYHRIRSEWFHLFVLPVVAVRLHDRVRIGLGFGYVRSMLKLEFGRDCAVRSCRGGLVEAPPFEDPRWTEKVTVEGAEDSFMFNLGVLLRLPGGFDVGLSYRSKVVGVGQDDIEAEGDATVQLYDPTATVPGWQTVRGRARVSYELPDTLAVGLKWQRKPWDVMTGFEWVRWGVHKNLRFSLSGNAFRGADMSNFDLNFVRHRGFRDVFRVRLLAGYRWETVHLSWGALFESSAVPSRWLAADAVDAHKLNFLVAVTWRPHKLVGLYLGYSVTLALESEVTESGFDPRYATGCVEDQVDILWSDNCKRVADGKGIPTAAGSYWQMVHQLGVGVSFDYE